MARQFDCISFPHVKTFLDSPKKYQKYKNVNLLIEVFVAFLYHRKRLLNAATVHRRYNSFAARQS